MTRLVAENIHVLRAGRELLSAASLTLAAGEVHALLGPNGAGKSTLLRALAGEWPIASGCISLSGQPLTRLTAQQQARQRAVLPQHDSLSFGFTVRQLVTLGRHAAARGSPAYERNLIDEMLALTDTCHLSERPYPALSGGEQRRAQLARVLVQVWDAATPILLLDEPTHSLDLSHQHALMAVLHAAASRGFAVLMSLHDINLAASAHRISLLKAGRLISTGTPAAVLDHASLRNLYGNNLAFTAICHDGRQQWLAGHAPGG